MFEANTLDDTIDLIIKSIIKSMTILNDDASIHNTYID